MAGIRCIIEGLPAKTRRWALGIGMAALLALGAIWLLPHGAPEPVTGSRLQSAAQGLTDYDVTLRLNPEEATLAIAETVQFTNRTGDALDALVVRTWLNAFQKEETSPAAAEELYDACYPSGFSAGGLTWYDVLWNGERASWSYVNEDETAMEIAVPALQNGESGALTLRCVARIPECAHRLGHIGEDYQLGNVLPILSRYEDGAWRADPYSPIGDPFVSDCANFHVTVHLPDGYMPACTAYLTKRDDGAWRGDALAVRDFALCASPNYHTASAKAGETVVVSCAFTEAGAKRALDDAKKALETFSDLYGAYPWPTLTVCAVHFPFSGMEYPAFIMAGEENYADEKADTLELTVAHETAHQWFYALAGSDQAKQPWQDEALCEYAMLRYVQKRYGQSGFDTLKYYRVDAPMRENIPGSLTPGSPIDYFGNLSDYSAVVYGRGAALLLALDELLPGGADAFLRAYAEEFAFQYVTRARFEAFLNRYSGMDLGPLVTDYLDTAM